MKRQVNWTLPVGAALLLLMLAAVRHMHVGAVWAMCAWLVVGVIWTWCTQLTRARSDPALNSGQALRKAVFATLTRAATAMAVSMATILAVVLIALIRR